MRRVLCLETPNLVGEEAVLKGWVRNRRDHGKLIFVDLHDYTGLIQLVIHASNSEVFETAEKLKPETVVEVSGAVKERPQNTINEAIPTGKVEMAVSSIKVLSEAQVLPFDMGGAELNLELPTLLDYRSLTLRHPKIAAIFKVQEVVIDSFRKSMKDQGFTEFQAPVIVPQTAEGGAEVFEVKYFDHKAYLSQSPQFYKQIMVGVFERVFSVNKTLRAEPSVTTRHLAESTTLDAEFGFIEGLDNVLDVAELTIKNVFDAVREEALDTLKMYGVELPKVADKIPRIKLREAQEILFKRTGKDNRKEPDLEPEEEKEISKWAAEEKGSELIFITHYPVDKRPFYTFEDPNDQGYTLSADLIGMGIEWMSGGQRINDYKKLLENAEKRGIDTTRSELYLQAFRYGMPPEGGFSFGSERIVMSILGLKNIREASLFPRDMERVDERFSSYEKQNPKE